MEQKKELIYGLNDRPPLRETIFAAVQHLLAIFVAIITPPLIISSELQFDLETTGYLISMSLFVSGIATSFNVNVLVFLAQVCCAFKELLSRSSVPLSELVCSEW